MANGCFEDDCQPGLSVEGGIVYGRCPCGGKVMANPEAIRVDSVRQFVCRTCGMHFITPPRPKVSKVVLPPD